MRKLKLQVQTSLDGYIAGPKGEMDWMVWNWDDKLKTYATALNNSVDTILMGKSFAKGFIPYWQGVAQDNQNPEQAFGKLMVDAQKVVFSATGDFTGTDASAWQNTRLTENSLAQEVKELKQQPGKDLIAYGGSAFAGSLIKEDSVDEYYLFVNPVALGQGLPLFNQLTENKKLQLKSAQAYGCGIAVLEYQKA
jgi:dihydrofolate reductase